MFACNEYKLLDEDLQERLVWIDGVFLMERRTSKIKAVLFSLYGFYVELFFAGDEPLFIKSFEELNKLDAYLDLINIDVVFENTKNDETEP